MWLGRRYLSKEDSMKPLPIAIAVTAVVSVAVCATSQAAPIAPISAAVTTNADNVAYMYNGHAYPIPLAWASLQISLARKLLQSSILSTRALLLLVIVIASTIRHLAQDRLCLGERLHVVRLPCQMSALGH